MKKTIRWIQVYETKVDLPAHANINNIKEFSDQLDFNTHVEGAEQQADTFEILDVSERKLTHCYDWDPSFMAEKTEDAYSAGSFRDWTAVCKVLKSRGFSNLEAEAILRSKWTRWCRDAYSNRHPAAAVTLAKYLDDRKIKSGHLDVAELVDGTF